MAGKPSLGAVRIPGNKRELGKTSCRGEGKEKENKPALTSSLNQRVPHLPSRAHREAFPGTVCFVTKGSL